MLDLSGMRPLLWRECRELDRRRRVRDAVSLVASVVLCAGLALAAIL